jgi:hypothetical protein
MATANPQTGVISVPGAEPRGSLLTERIKALPKAAQDKLRLFERERAKLVGTGNALYELKMKANARKAKLAFELEHQKRDLAGGYIKFGPADRQHLADVEAEIVECAKEEASFDKDRAELPAIYSVERLTDMLIKAPSGQRYKPCHSSVALRKGQSPIEALAETRGAIAEFQEQARIADEAPVPLAEAEATVFAEVDRLAVEGKPKFEHALAAFKTRLGGWRGGTLSWSVKYDEDQADYVPDAFTTLVWLHADAIKAHARDSLRANASPEDALSFEERKLRIAECETALLNLERKEEVLVQMCGAAASRRWDANPLAVLQIEIDNSPVPVAAPTPDQPEPPRRRSRNSGHD